MCHKFILLLKASIFVSCLLFASDSWAGYYMVYATPDKVVECHTCNHSTYNRPSHHRSHYYSHSRHHHRSTAQITVYYGWYTYAGAVWIPSPCSCCDGRAMQRPVWRSTDSYTMYYMPDEYDYDYNSIDTGTADNNDME